MQDVCFFAKGKQICRCASIHMCTLYVISLDATLTAVMWLILQTVGVCGRAHTACFEEVQTKGDGKCRTWKWRNK